LQKYKSYFAGGGFVRAQTMGCCVSRKPTVAPAAQGREQVISDIFSFSCHVVGVSNRKK